MTAMTFWKIPLIVSFLASSSIRRSRILPSWGMVLVDGAQNDDSRPLEDEAVVPPPPPTMTSQSKTTNAATNGATTTAAAAATTSPGSRRGRTNTVNCRLEIQLDDHPEDTTWEVRGPLPNHPEHTIDGVFPYYYDERTREVIKERLTLQEGSEYFLLIKDHAGDGIADGYWKLVGEYGEESKLGDVVIDEDEACTLGSGHVYEILIPTRSQLQDVLSSSESDDEESSKVDKSASSISRIAESTVSEPISGGVSTEATSNC